MKRLFASLLLLACGQLAAQDFDYRLSATPIARDVYAFIGKTEDFGPYLAGVVLTGGLWNFPMAYQMGMIATSDERGNIAVLMPAALAVGGALGPVLAGALLAGGHGYAPLYGLFAGATAIGLAAFIVMGRRLASGA